MMMIVGLLIVFAFCAFVALGVMCEIRGLQRNENRAMLEVAKWLAGYNFAQMALMQDVMADRLQITYADVVKLVRNYALNLNHNAYLGMGQSVPIEYVPEKLLSAAGRYNLTQLDLCQQPITIEGLGQRHVEAAVAATLARMQGTYPDVLAAELHMDYATVYKVVSAMRTRLTADLEHKLLQE